MFVENVTNTVKGKSTCLHMSPHYCYTSCFPFRAFLKHIQYVYVDLKQIFFAIYYLKKLTLLLRAGTSESGTDISHSEDINDKQSSTHSPIIFSISFHLQVSISVVLDH